jgi:hypothetical protein
MRRVAGIGVAKRVCTLAFPLAGRSPHPLTCPNLRWVLITFLSKLTYMSHVVWSCEQVRDGCLCWRHRRPFSGSWARRSSRPAGWKPCAVGPAPLGGARTAGQHAGDAPDKPESRSETGALRAKRALRSTSVVLVRDVCVPASAETIGSWIR